MFKRVFDGVVSGVKSACGYVKRNALPMVCAGVVGVGLMVGADALLAQGTSTFTPQDVTVEELVKFGGIFDTLKGWIAPVVGGGIGIGLAIWGARYLFRIIKSAGR